VGPQQSHPRVPDFFIVGHAKCGTTAMYEMLRRHRQIYMPSLKEPEFFASEMRVGARPGVFPDTLDEYLALFAKARADQLAGEASTSYLRTHAAASRIAQVQPQARIIAILREPASLLRSVHLEFLQMLIETEHDLRKALALEQDRRRGKNLPKYGYRPQALLYSEHVQYVQQLRRYQTTFSPENVLVLIYDDFRADNEGTVREVLRFLGADDRLPIANVDVNPTVASRSQALHELVHAVAVGRGPVTRRINAALATLPERPRKRALRALRKVMWGAPPATDERLMADLRGRFRPEVVALSDYLNRDLLSLWGYEQA
jgi:hypothetical protein